MSVDARASHFVRRRSEMSVLGSGVPLVSRCPPAEIRIFISGPLRPLPTTSGGGWTVLGSRLPPGQQMEAGSKRVGGRSHDCRWRTGGHGPLCSCTWSFSGIHQAFVGSPRMSGPWRPPQALRLDLQPPLEGGGGVSVLQGNRDAGPGPLSVVRVFF